MLYSSSVVSRLVFDGTTPHLCKKKKTLICLGQHKRSDVEEGEASNTPSRVESTEEAGD